MKRQTNKFLSFALALVLSVSATGIGARAASDVRISSRFWELFFGNDEKSTSLIVGGGVFGVKIKESFVTVAEAKGTPQLRAGDIILSVDGKNISSAKDVEAAIKASGGAPMTLTVRRGESVMQICAAAREVSGEYRLGIKLRDTAAGIGTVTYIDKESGRFGGLGHGICDADSGEVIATSGGEAVGVLLGGVHRGEAGKPGELSGVLTAKKLGSISANTECGVFGTLTESALSEIDGEEFIAAKPSELHTGFAEIISTVKNGEAKRYSIEITEIGDGSQPTKCFKIKVTDKTLIAITGGIVRGMSGSPIIQDGKLVGAVTHVMVADPTEGYGIFIENMLNASQEARNELPSVA